MLSRVFSVLDAMEDSFQEVITDLKEISGLNGEAKGDMFQCRIREGASTPAHVEHDGTVEHPDQMHNPTPASEVYRSSRARECAPLLLGRCEGDRRVRRAMGDRALHSPGPIVTTTMTAEFLDHLVRYARRDLAGQVKRIENERRDSTDPAYSQV
ncbi:hypothetical protein FVEG_17342 [Fusarium verticillioides 7600]|uniref:Uncharacterized protein n=1 Tax=Gibberella moniliformis (strain M3125 / FGSC 7600) TaxID=334819 RepID=W7MTW1_GIBM7|nr:hypothetical protein FVEG_17342 [Fusarium verticillioides 7600]EWG54611.1 hypothetical protein FVEG_17342 [Fusarium verticillioides 7600]